MAEAPREDIAAVIPAFRCETTIAQVVRGVLAHVALVIVVDDGSGDRTAERALGAGALVEQFDTNQGKGRALAMGISKALQAGPQAVLLLDADGQHAPEDIPSFLTAWDQDKGDLVVGARLADRQAIPTTRYWANYLGSRILSFMTGYQLEDSQSGYRLVSSDLLEGMKLRSKGYAVESEMLIKAAKHKARLAHVTVRTIYEEDGQSHFRPLLDTLRISWWSVYFKALG